MNGNVAGMRLDQDWFEMRGIRKKNFASSVWIPLRACELSIHSGKVGYSGYKCEFFGCATVAISVLDEDKARELTWRNLNQSGCHSPRVDDEKYVPAEIFDAWPLDLQGLNLMMVPRCESEERQEWIVNQDLVLALSLIREGDVWRSPYENYMDVIRLTKDDEDNCVRLEIRTSHLRDYLCARKMGLRISSYYSREVCSPHKEGIAWSGDERVQDSNDVHWEGRLRDTLEGGGWPGMTFAVIDVSRTDLDPDDDIPVMNPPTEENTSTETRTGIRQGKENFQIEGVVTKTEWINPSSKSPRVRGDSLPPTTFFSMDAEGNRQNSETLSDSGRWLWFKPTVIRDLLGCRGSSLRWSSLQTGDISCSNDSGVHFGVNALGLINVFAKDISLLPDWQQQLWAGHGAAPEGKLSDELFTQQVRGKFVDTRPPEEAFREGVERMRGVSTAAFGATILASHDDYDEILATCHRFRSTDTAGLLSLAKDVARLTSDSFDGSVCSSIIPELKGKNLGGRNALQKLIASRIGDSEARALMGPLAGIYDLRLCDAHLPGSGVASKAFEVIGLNPTDPILIQGTALLAAASRSVSEIADVLEKWNDPQTSNEP